MTREEAIVLLRRTREAFCDKDAESIGWKGPVLKRERQNAYLQWLAAVRTFNEGLR